MRNDIENKLKEMEGGIFQRLCNEILYREYRSTPKNEGGQIGSNKTITGTPDAWMRLESGKYVFIEYTTQEKDMYRKFSNDIEKCLNEEKTGIKIELIDEIIIMHNRKCKLDEYEKIKSTYKILNEKNIKLTEFGIDDITKLLEYKYLYLSKEYFGIENTRQVIGLDEFCKQAKDTTPLAKDIHGREIEKENLVKSIEGKDIVIVKGNQGVGKTAIATNVLNELVSEYKVLCIKYKDDRFAIINDLSKYLLEEEKYILFIDDANKFDGFEDIIVFLENKNIKIVLTVRNYALDDIKEFIERCDVSFCEQEIEILSNEVINEICNDYNIRNLELLERINKISNGNPRLAIMMCLVVKKEDYEKIINVSYLLELYYKDTNGILSNNIYLKTLSIVALFYKININNEKQIEKICKLFELPILDFKNAYNELYRKEYLDFYKSEVLSISDQTFSEFVLYKIFLEKKIVKLDLIIEEYFISDTYDLDKKQIIKVINDLVNYHTSEEIIDYIGKIIVGICNRKKENIYYEDFLVVFGNLNLSGVYDYLDSSIKHDNKININLDLFKILIGNEEYYKAGIYLSLEYLDENVSKFDEIKKLLTEFGYSRLLYDNYYTPSSYDKQEYMLLEVYKKISNDETKNPKIFKNLVVQVIYYYLKYNYEIINIKDIEVAIREISILDNQNQNLVSLRDNAWCILIKLFDDKEYTDEIVKYIGNYQIPEINDKDKKIIENDFENINKIIEKIDFNNLNNCIYINRFDEKFKEYKKIKIDYKNEKFNICKILLIPTGDRGKEKLLKSLKDFSDEDYIKIIDVFDELYNLVNYENYYMYIKNNVKKNIKNIILNIEEEDVFCYGFRKVKNYLDSRVDMEKIIDYSINLLGYEKTEEFLKSDDFENVWILLFYLNLETEKNPKKNLEYIMKILENNNIPTYINFNLLKKYLCIDGDIFNKVIKILLLKEDKRFYWICQLNIDEVENNIDLDILKKVIMFEFKNSENIGLFNGYNDILDLLLYKDEKFPNEFVRMSISEGSLKVYIDKIWDLNNYEMIINELILNFYEKYLELVKTGELEVKSHKDKKLNYIINNINKFNDSEKLEYIFFSMNNFDEEQRLKLIDKFLDINNSKEDFLKIMPDYALLYRGIRTVESEKDIAYYKKIKKILQKKNIFSHMSYIDEQIKNEEIRFERRKIREYMRK